VPNLASKVLRLSLDRLLTDWQSSYGHPVLVVETFVDVAQFCGTVLFGERLERTRPDQRLGPPSARLLYYVKHEQPKRLFCRQLFKNARRSLQTEHLKPALAVVEQKVSSCNGVDTSDAQTMSPQPISNPPCPKTITVRHSV
jgi:Domain of unknown function (DUF4338)